MKLIFGLGNPGREYENTYHNLGFMALDKLASRLGISINKAKFNSIYGDGRFNNEIVFLIKPLTYMNLSGNAVRDFARYYKVEPQDIIVFVDDIDLDKGVSRLRLHGSAGTHNGLKSIVYKLGSEDFVRLKIGAGQDRSIDLKDYVLSKIDDESLSLILPSIDEGIEKVLQLFKKWKILMA